MIRRNATLVLLLAMALPLIFLGCEDDSAGPGASPADFRGVWDVEGEVVAKRTCFSEIGDMRQWDVTIAQDGSRGIISFGGSPHELTINGSTATASWPEESDIDVRLTISEGTLGGTITATNTQGETPCTEVVELSGTRASDPPAPGFAGIWDLMTEVTFSVCEGEDLGDTDEVCRTINVDGASISIDEPDGTILGIIDGNLATLWRLDGENVLTLELRAAEGGLTGVAYERGDCAVDLSIEGTSRQGDPCPPPPTPSDFDGSWFPDLYRVSTFGCSLIDPRGQYFGQCITVTVNGSSVTVDDGSGRGMLSGSIDESGVVVSRNEGDGIYELRLEMGEEGLAGSSSKNYTSGECSGGDLEFDFDAIRLPLPCESSGGPFAGAWDLEVTLTVNDCQFPPADPECVEIFQSGSLVFIEGAFLDGNQATVTGNDLSIHEETVFEGTRFILDTVLQVGGGGSTLTGTQTLTIQEIASPQNSCTSSGAISGTRTTSCQPDLERDAGTSVFGLRLRPETAR